MLAVLIIAFFTYYLSVVKDMPFRARFLEMAGISLGVAFISFLVGLLMRTIFGVEISTLPCLHAFHAWMKQHPDATPG